MTATADRLAEKLAELAAVNTAIDNTPRNPGCVKMRGKQHNIRYDAALRRTAQLFDRMRNLEREIAALGGTVPERETPVEPKAAPVPLRPAKPSPRGMTDEELKEADERMEAERRATGARSITEEHRAVKAELGRRWRERTTKAVRSAAGKKGAATRARRKAAGLPPMRQPFSFDNAPTGGWTDADRVV